MKKLFLFLSVLIAGFVEGQNNAHPTIDEIKVIYKAASTATVIANNKYQVNIQPQIFVTLKSLNDVAKIYFEILKKDSSTVVYTANYSINSSPVIQNNTKLFSVTDNTVFLSCLQNIPRDIYIIKVYTKNSNDVASPIYYEKN